MTRKWTIACVALMVAALGAVALDGAGGYVATEVVAESDINSAGVTEETVTAIADGHKVAVASDGTIYLLVFTFANGVGRNEIVRCEDDGNGGLAHTLVAGAHGTDTIYQAILVAPATAGGLLKDHLVAMSETFNSGDGDPLGPRDILMFDPDDLSAEPVQLFTETGPVHSDGGGRLLAADADGNLYLMETTNAGDGEIRKLTYDAVAGEYVAETDLVLTSGNAGHALAVDADGFLFTLAKDRGAILRVDPAGTDDWTEFATTKGSFLAVAVDTAGVVFAAAGDARGRYVTKVSEGASVSRKGRIAQTSETVRTLIAGNDGSLLALERIAGAGSFDDTVYSLAPDSSGGGGGGGGGGNGGGKGNGKPPK